MKNFENRLRAIKRLQTEKLQGFYLLIIRTENIIKTENGLILVLLKRMPLSLMIFLVMRIYPFRLPARIFRKRK